MSTSALSIIIITLNEEGKLPRLLSDLAGQTWKDFEIIHVDSNSDDATVQCSHDAAPQFENYQIVEMDRRGVSLGRNTGANHAQAERLLFLDADTRVAPDFLQTAMWELDLSQSDVGVVCMSAQGLPLHQRLGFALMNVGIHVSSQFFPTAVGACLFSTRTTHKRIGGFDESLSLCEDCNYALKAYRLNRCALSVLETKFRFDPRRLNQDGFLRTGMTYLRANVRRFFKGELHNQEVAYSFGHYR